MVVFGSCNGTINWSLRKNFKFKLATSICNGVMTSTQFLTQTNMDGHNWRLIVQT
jgi:hypothetical protein